MATLNVDNLKVNGNTISSTDTDGDINLTPDGTGSVSASGDLKFNSGYGSVATAYGCRAWVNFNGTGTVAIRASGNVSSITDRETGKYTINLSTAMPDTNFCGAGLSGLNTNGDGANNYNRMAHFVPATTSSGYFNTFDVSGALSDQQVNLLMIVR